MHSPRRLHRRPLAILWSRVCCKQKAFFVLQVNGVNVQETGARPQTHKERQAMPRDAASSIPPSSSAVPVSQSSFLQKRLSWKIIYTSFLPQIESFLYIYSTSNLIYYPWQEKTKKNCDIVNCTRSYSRAR